MARGHGDGRRGFRGWGGSFGGGIKGRKPWNSRKEGRCHWGRLEKIIGEYKGNNGCDKRVSREGWGWYRSRRLVGEHREGVTRDNWRWRR